MSRLLASLLIVILAGQASAQQRVELELVLALDSSTSVDPSEFELQRTGLARAFRSANVQAAISALGKRGVAVAVVQWSGQGQQALALDWQVVRDPGSAEAFARKLAAMPRALDGFTDIHGAISFSTRQLLDNSYRGARLTIDVSGDGTSDKRSPAPARDFAVGQGITINGLVIFSHEHDLGDLARFALQAHYHKEVIGGPGAFLMSAHRFRNFAEAIEKKLVREILGPGFVMR